MWVIMDSQKQYVLQSMKWYVTVSLLKNKILKDGDIINIDVAIIKDGYFGDTSRMYYVGNVNPHAKN